MNYGAVYCITNTVNNKKYIGVTTRHPYELRWKNHQRRAANGSLDCPYFYNALRYYGAPNFKFEVIYEGQSREELSIKEDFYEKQLNTQNENSGYNIRDGGFNGALPEGVKQKISRSRLALHHHHTEETKEKIRESKKKNPYHPTPAMVEATKIRLKGNTFGFKKGHSPWNTGLDPEDSRVRAAVKKRLKNMKENGTLGTLPSHTKYLTAVQIEEIQKLISQGTTIGALAHYLQVDPTTVQKLLKRHNLPQVLPFKGKRLSQDQLRILIKLIDQGKTGNNLSKYFNMDPLTMNKLLVYYGII